MDGTGWDRPPALHSVKTPTLASETGEVELNETDRSTILLGYTLGSARLEDGSEVIVIGSGNTIEFRVSGAGRDFRFNLNELAAAAVRMARS